MSVNSPSLILNKLVLVGIRKNYIVPFHVGLNVIYGDSDTGKSSILNLINYCLGSKNVEMYDELEYSGKYCLLELYLNNKIYTIKRDIFNPNEFVEVYYTDIENMDNVFPYKYSPSYKKDAPAGYLSDFLLKALNIPLIKIKKAPSKIDSDCIRLSFRDIFKFCYLNQDDVGSKDILDSKNGSVFTKNKETFKFIHNVLDSQITELQGDISEKEKQKKNLEKNYNIITSFLRETQIKPMDILNNELENLIDQINAINSEIDKLNKNMSSNTEFSNELRELIQKLKSEINEKEHKKVFLQMELEQNVKLKREYDKDINKLKSSLEVGGKLPNNVDEVKCPVCNNKLPINELKKCLNDNDMECLKEEIKALKHRKNNLIRLIDQQYNEIALLDSKIKQSIDDLNKGEVLLDENTKEYISPYISQRDGLITERAAFKEKKERIEYFRKLRKQVNLINDDVQILQTQISKLIENVENLKQNAPSTQDIVSVLGDCLNEFLDFVKIKNPSNIGISNRNFLPIVRGKEYTQLTSGGLRTLTSIGYYVSLLKNSIEKDTNLPKFIMIDTVGKYIGKTKEKYLNQTDVKQDKKEGIDDPNKYLNIYKYLIGLCDTYEKKGSDASFQIIVVDNEIPEEIEQVIDKYYVKRFSSDGEEGYDSGFIDDISY